MSALKTPIVSVFIGEGGSGGALGLAVADEVWMTENAVYSVISPEGCASILWKDPARVADAAECLKLTASDLYSLGVIDRILLETGGESVVFSTLKVLLARKLRALCAVDPAELTGKTLRPFSCVRQFPYALMLKRSAKPYKKPGMIMYTKFLSYSFAAFSYLSDIAPL